MNDQPAITWNTRTILMTAFGTVPFLLASGFALGFFPAYLGEGGSAAKGIDHGWKFALLLLALPAVMALLQQIVKRFPLPALAQHLTLFVVCMSFFYAGSGIITEDENAVWWNLLRGMYQGLFIGGVFYWLQKRNLISVFRG